MPDEGKMSLLRSVLSSAWQAPQTLAGLGVGMMKTKRLPRITNDPEGNQEFEFDVEGEEPLSMGQVLVAPKDITGEHRAHERVHAEQSRRYGPGYIPMRMLGDLMGKIDVGDAYLGNPMEDEAYLRTANSDELATRLALKKAYRNMR